MQHLSVSHVVSTATPAIAWYTMHVSHAFSKLHAWYTMHTVSKIRLLGHRKSAKGVQLCLINSERCNSCHTTSSADSHSQLILAAWVTLDCEVTVAHGSTLKQVSEIISG